MPHRKLYAYVGHRGIVLALLGVIWLILGIGLIDQPPVVGFMLDWMPPQVWPALWIGPALVALVAAGWRRLDALAWGLLMAPCAERCLSYGFAWLFGTFANAWRGTLVYAALGLMIYHCAAGLDRPAPGLVQTLRETR